MSVRRLDTLGAQQNAWTINSEDSASVWREIARLDEGEFEVKRTGAEASAGCTSSTNQCPGGTNYWVTPGLTLASSQSIEVETFDPFDTDFPSGEVPPGDSVTATVTAHEYVDSIYNFYWWFQADDTLSDAQGVTGATWLWGQGCTVSDSSCTFTPVGSGRLYVSLNVRAGSAYPETAHSDIIWSEEDFHREIRLTPVDGDWSVYPADLFEDSDLQVEVAVLGHGGSPVSGHSVGLTLSGNGSTAGHIHPDSSKTPVEMPPGSFDAAPSTVASGIDTVLYRAGIHAGVVTILATSDSITSITQDIEVAFPGLVEYAQTAYDTLIGQTSKHPDNHYASSEMVGLLQDLSESYYERYGAKLAYNDMSLEWGGKFNWPASTGFGGGSHVEHRRGESLDLRIWYGNQVTKEDYLSLGEDMPTARGRWLTIWWEEHGGDVLDESDDNHYHLRYPGDSRR